VIGGSKGAEAALILASRRPDIRAVVAGVPTNVVWQGIDFSDWSQVKSSWSLAGKPMDFVPYAAGVNTGRIRDIYDRSLPPEGDEGAAAIPVERIESDVLLISGDQDALWPSKPMSERIERRLTASGFRFRVVHLPYPDAATACWASR
jgi:pimeloyl-ACP methyl ester carboxylesterase